MKSKRAGLSTLEALVALAILGVTLAPLFALQAQLARGAAREEAMLLRLHTQRDALAILRGVNPSEQRAGKRALGDGRVLEWQAKPISKTVRTVAEGGGDGNFDITLYRMETRALAQDGSVIAAFAVDQVGFEERVASQASDEPRTSRARAARQQVRDRIRDRRDRTQ